MNKDFYVIDGCAFAENAFTGVSDKVKASPLSAFFLTTPGEDEGMLSLSHNIGGIYNMADKPESGLRVVRTIAELEQAKADGYTKTLFGRRRYIPELVAQNAAVKAFGKRGNNATNVVFLCQNKVSFDICIGQSIAFYFKEGVYGRINARTLKRADNL